MSRIVPECENCAFFPSDIEKTYVCSHCGYVLTSEDKKRLLAESDALGKKEREAHE